MSNKNHTPITVVLPDEAELDLSSLGNFSENLTGKASVAHEAETSPNVSPTDDGEDTIRLGSLSDEYEGKRKALTFEEILEEKGTYEKAVTLIKTEGGSVERGIALLKQSAEEGCGKSWIYLGRLYGNEKGDNFDPAYSFSCFSEAAKLDMPEGFYYLGICYMNGVGCDRDVEKAVEILLHGGELGHAESIRALGICREHGIGCELDYTLAAKLYERAAESGDAIATNNLGGCYFYGHGVVQDKERAYALYKRADELGCTNATCRLGVCHETGEGCDKDGKLAFSYYKKAADNGNAVALYHLASCYDSGIGTEQNFAKAFSYYNKSASAGYALAMYRAAIMSKNGRGTKKDTATAYKMFTLAAEAGLSEAAYELGNCNAEGIGTVRNTGLAYLHYLEAAESEGGNANAAFKLGLCNLKGLGTVKDENVAFQWFSQGAELGSAEAAYMRGECYLYGIGVYKDAQRATECYIEAISKDGAPCAEAHSALAKCLEKGIGIDCNPEGAIKHYKIAAELGSAESAYDLGRLAMTGVGAQSDRAEARTYILRSARSEYPPAMLAMGIFADEGRGVAKNFSDAERWYTKAVSSIAKTAGIDEFPERSAERAEAVSSSKIEAQYRLGMLLATHEPSAQSCIRAFENIAFAASLGHENAQAEIAKIYRHGGDLKSYYESEACKSQEEVTKETLGSAINKLGDAYFDGKTLVKKNEVTAARCYKIAAELGNVDACYSYGWCLRHGVGLNENDVAAVKWLKLAADKGNINAAYSYGLCCEEGSGTGIKNKREARSYYRKAAAAGHIEAAKRYMALSK